jgi:hypothetical protein
MTDRILSLMAANSVSVSLALPFCSQSYSTPEPLTRGESAIGKVPRELVYSRSGDDVVSAGVRFSSAKESTKPITVPLGPWLGLLESEKSPSHRLAL